MAIKLEDGGGGAGLNGRTISGGTFFAAFLTCNNRQVFASRRTSGATGTPYHSGHTNTSKGFII